MKELSIEEKAKAYDEAIIRAKSLIGDTIINESGQHIAEVIFPELAESEDEKVRKDMLDYCYKRMNNEFLSITIDQVEIWTAWLEKQRSHQKFLDSIQVGDRVTRNEDGVLVNLTQLNRIAKREEPTYTKKDIGDAYLKGLEDAKSTEIKKDPCKDCYAKSLNCQNFPCDAKKAFEQKSDNKVEPKFKVGNWYQCTKDFFGKGVTFGKNTAYYCAKEGCLQNEYGCHIAIVKDLYDNFKLWTIQDAKEGDVIYTPKGAGVEGIFLIEGWEQVEYTGKTLFSSIGYRVKDGEIVAGGLGAIWWEGVIDIFYPATKEQRDILFQKMHEAGYEWDAEKKELKKIEQKTPWLKELKEKLDSMSKEEFQQLWDKYKQPFEPTNETLEKPVWSEEDEELYREALVAFASLYNEVDPVADWEKLYSWFKSLKEKIQPQPKQEWSEEDSVRLQRIIDFLWHNRKGDTDTIYQQEQDIDWLKSLRPQNTWKPSYEQINVCKEVYADILSAKGFDLGTVNSELNRMEEQLRKLKD